MPSDSTQPDDPTIPNDTTPAPPSDDTARIELDAPVVAAPYVPRPKPVILPERTAEGFRTQSLHLKRTPGGFYLDVDGYEQHTTVHLSESQLESLYLLTEGSASGLWRKLCEIPLERPRPSRALEEELRILLTSFATELRRRR